MKMKHRRGEETSRDDEYLGKVNGVIAEDIDHEANMANEDLDKERIAGVPDDCSSHDEFLKEGKGNIENLNVKAKIRISGEDSHGELEEICDKADGRAKVYSFGEYLYKDRNGKVENVDQNAKIHSSEEEFDKKRQGMVEDVNHKDKDDNSNEGIQQERIQSSDKEDLYKQRQGKTGSSEKVILEERNLGKLQHGDHKGKIQSSEEDFYKGTERKLEDVDDKSKGHSCDEDLVMKRVSLLLKHAKALQTAGSALSSRLRVEEQNLSQQAVSLEKEMKIVKSDVISALEMGKISLQVAEKLEEKIDRAHWMIYESDVRALLSPKFNGTFLRLFLGPVNVKAAGDDVRFKVKEEYNAYRHCLYDSCHAKDDIEPIDGSSHTIDRTAALFLMFPLILWMLKNWLWNGCFPALPVQAYQAWLLFFYTSLALRENILRINGSDIRSWWIYHHYCAMLMAVISLTWDFKGQHPHCEEKQHGIRHFLLWAMMQGVVMLLQNRYQRQRLYTRIALGKAGRMDVVWGETAGNDGQILLLYPLLFALQIFQGFIGFLLLRTAVTKRSDWQVSGCGILLLVMALGNFVNTLDTLFVKMKIKNRMKGKLTFAKKSF